MSKISETFTNGKAFIPFLTAGDPSIDVTEELIENMAKSGADLIEIGIPFSDPVAEGIVIQEADKRALEGGITIDKIFDMVKSVRKKTNIPLVFMTYINPIFRYGKEKFMKKCYENGMDGIIVPDLPFEEKEELQIYCEKYKIELISLIAPTSKERIKEIAKSAEGFIYCVSSLGVTGVRSNIQTNVREMVETVKEVRDIPCAIGFGISEKKQANEMSKYSDGIIVGSAIVKIIEKYGKNAVNPVCDYVRGMKEAITIV